jgi:hypothetical protein
MTNRPMVSGTIMRLTEGVTVTVGKVVLLNPLGAPAPTSPVLAASEVGTLAVVRAAFLEGVPLRPWAELRIFRAGSSNDGRVVRVRAEDVSDEVLG